MTEHDRYRNPLCVRYASTQMQQIFSEQFKFSTWRRLWVELAKAQKELGLPITQAQIDQLEAHVSDINYDVAQAQEKLTRHDVMAHIHAYGEQCPDARAIIHLGATSCYVGDNANLIVMREGMRLLRRKVLSVIAQLAGFAMEHKDLPTLAFTHFQPAQPTTVGKRATLWLHDLLLDLDEIDHLLGNIKLLGSKGTTGTQASFRELFGGDYDKARKLDRHIADALGFAGVYPVSGQTYSRKIDDRFMQVLSGIAQSAHKFANDIRLLQHLKEIEEPFEKTQVGSSAMAYKRNPMRCERITGLCRYVLSDAANTALTASEQWMERTLDDSANWRIAIPEAFLAVDGILDIYLNVTGNMVVYPKVIEQRLRAELPFMATENLLMDAVKRGGDRQELHERIRVHSMEAARAVKEQGLPNDLPDRLASDESFGVSRAELDALMEPVLYVGFAPEQTESFLRETVYPLLEENKEQLMNPGDLPV